MEQVSPTIFAILCLLTFDRVMFSGKPDNKQHEDLAATPVVNKFKLARENRVKRLAEERE
jgi:hypothetical protein